MNSDQPPASLEARIQRIEDHIAISQLITAYGAFADAGEVDAMRDIWTDDAIYDTVSLLHGEEVIDLFRSASFLEILSAGSAHAATSPHIVIEGDQASATQYAMLYKHGDAGFEMLRLVASRWLLKRTKNGWRAFKRTNRSLDGDDEARKLLARVRTPPSADD